MTICSLLDIVDTHTNGFFDAFKGFAEIRCRSENLDVLCVWDTHRPARTNIPHALEPTGGHLRHNGEFAANAHA